MTSARQHSGAVEEASLGLNAAAEPGGVTRQVIRQITDAINNGVYAPGMRLPSERTMARDLQVGRKAITAAYEHLENRGLLRRFRGKGAFVCQPMDAGAAFSWSGKDFVAGARAGRAGAGAAGARIDQPHSIPALGRDAFA